MKRYTAARRPMGMRLGGSKDGPWSKAVSEKTSRMVRHTSNYTTQVHDGNVCGELEKGESTASTRPAGVSAGRTPPEVHGPSFSLNPLLESSVATLVLLSIPYSKVYTHFYIHF